MLIEDDSIKTANELKAIRIQNNNTIASVGNGFLWVQCAVVSDQNIKKQHSKWNANLDN